MWETLVELKLVIQILVFYGSIVGMISFAYLMNNRKDNNVFLSLIIAVLMVVIWPVIFLVGMSSVAFKKEGVDGTNTGGLIGILGTISPCAVLMIFLKPKEEICNTLLGLLKRTDTPF